MKISNNICDAQFIKPVVTIGSFDGVHIGHKEILKSVKKRAKEIGGESVVVTFSPHPRIALNKDMDNLYFLNSFKERSYLLEREGIDHLIILPFDKSVWSQTMSDFFLTFIKDGLDAKALVMGYNHRFGADKDFDNDKLLELAACVEVEIIRVDKQGVDERDVSSTTIRNLLRRGDIERANSYLGRPYIFIGDCDSSGKMLYGEFQKLYPKDGRYKVVVTFENEAIEAEATVKEGALFLDGISMAMNSIIVQFIGRI